MTIANLDHERIEILARRNGVEHTLYLAEAIGDALVVAGNGLGAVGDWYCRRAEDGPAPSLGSEVLH